MGKKGGGGNEAAAARAEEAARQAEIRAGTQKIDETFGQNFNDQYFTGLRTNYENYARPQLEDQYGKARDQLAFALARSGTTDSSMAGYQAGELDKVNALRAREMADKALNFETTARNNVEQARSDLVNTLNVTGDAQGAVNSATNRAAILSRPPEYSPLENLFADFTSALGTQAAFERAYALGSPVKPTYNTGLFGGSGSSVRKY